MTRNTHHEIPINHAVAMQTDFTGTYDSEPEGGFFFRQGIDAILAQTNCIGLRYYYTYDEGKLKVIMLGVKKVTYNDLYDKTIIIGDIEADSTTPVDQTIALTTATGFTGLFRNKYPALMIGGFFFRSIIDYFIGVNGVIGLRYKFGLNAERNVKLILNPVDSSFNDIVIMNADNIEIKAETSGGGGDENAANPLTH